MSVQVHNGLKSSRFINMCVANWFLHIYVYAMIPLLSLQTLGLGSEARWVGWGVLAFAIGMVLPGPFGAYLMERLDAAQALGLTAKDCFVFEDSISGLTAGRDSGATVIGLTTTIPAARIASLCQCVINDFTEITVAQMCELKK